MRRMVLTIAVLLSVATTTTVQAHHSATAFDNGGLWILGRRGDGMVLSSRVGRGPVSQAKRPAQSAGQAASAQCPRAEVVEVTAQELVERTSTDLSL